LAREKGYSDLERFLEEYERDFEGLTSVSKEDEEVNNEESDEDEEVNNEESEASDEDYSSSLEELKNQVQDLSDQISNLSDLEENSSNLLNLPSQIDEKMGEIIEKNEEMKKKLEEEDQKREETHQLTIQELKDQIEQQEKNHQTKLQHLDEKDLQREESYNQMRNQHENEIQDFRDILGDMDHKVQRLNKRIFHQNLEIKSLKSLVSSYHDPSNVSLEDMRAQIEEVMNAISFNRLNQEERERYLEITRLLEDEEEELSLQDLQIMLVELQQMNQPTNGN